MNARVRRQNPQQLADKFNAAHHVGVKVRYWTGLRQGDGQVSETRSPADVLGGHTAVVWVRGEAGCIALSHVEAL